MPETVVETEHREIAQHLDAGTVGRNQDHALLTVGRTVRIRLAHEDDELAVRVENAGGVPLSAVEHVLVTVAPDRRGDVGGVGAGHGRFGHGERGPDPTVEQGLEPVLLLLLGAEHGEDLHVAGVRGGAVDGLVADDRAPDHLGERGVLEVGESGSESVVRHEQVPQSLRARCLLQFAHHRRLLVLVRVRRDLGVVHLLGGQNMVGHECLEGLEQRVGTSTVGEVHGWPPGGRIERVNTRTRELRRAGRCRCR